MTAPSKGTRVTLFLVLFAAVVAALIFVILQMHRAPPAGSSAVTAAPTASKPPPDVPDQKQAVLPKAQPPANAEKSTVTAAPAASPPPDSDANVPTFDIARIEPSGDAVIAGRAAPGVTIELLRNGEIHDRVTVDRSGQFAMVPPRLPPGSYELTLRARQADGTQISSKQSVAVMLEPKSSEPPVAALIAPNKPTVVLPQPATPKPATGTVVVEAADIEPDGKLHVSGRAGPGAAVRFYLNDSFVAAATAGADGRFTITINQGVVPGDYRVRLDEIEPKSGAVLARAEVPLNVPSRVVASASPPKPAATPPASAAPPQPSASPAPQQPPAAAPPPSVATPPQQPVATKQPAVAAQQPTAPAQPAQQPQRAPSTVVVPKIETARVSRGDNLWRISQTTYGAGIRYSVIFRANRDQIRNPNLIYPGQIFVLPAR